MELFTSQISEFLILALFFVPAILFLLTQYRTIKLIQPRNRSIAPGEVFLQLIPFFGMIWQFFVVIRLSNSIWGELTESTFTFEQTSMVFLKEDERPTFRVGITYCILFCCYIIPFIGTIAFAAGTVCWIIYWVQLRRYKRKLEEKRYLLSSPPSRP